MHISGLSPRDPVCGRGRDRGRGRGRGRARGEVSVVAFAAEVITAVTVAHIGGGAHALVTAVDVAVRLPLVRNLIEDKRGEGR
jgi:hypothetical protein